MYGHKYLIPNFCASDFEIRFHWAGQANWAGPADTLNGSNMKCHIRKIHKDMIYHINLACHH